MTTRPLRPAPTAPGRFAGLTRTGAGFLALVGAAALVAGLVGSTVVGAPVVPGIPGPSALVRWGIPMARIVLDGAAVATVGLALTARMLGFDHPEISEPALRPARRAALWTSVIWGLASLASLVLLTAEFGTTPTPAAVWRYVSTIAAGKALLLSMATALLSWWLARTAVRHGESVPAELRAGVPLFGLLGLPLTGHASNWRYHDLSMISMELHVVGAAAWAGGLGAIVLLLARRPEALALALPRFSRLATWCVALVAATGVFNGLLELALSPVTRLPDSLVSTPYGVLLMAKALCFGLVGVTAIHVRLRLLPRVVRGRPAGVALWCAWEVLILAAATGIAVMLTRAPVTPF